MNLAAASLDLAELCISQETPSLTAGPAVSRLNGRSIYTMIWSAASEHAEPDGWAIGKLSGPMQGGQVVIMVKYNVLPSVQRLVMELSSPTLNARLVHIELVGERPFKQVYHDLIRSPGQWMHQAAQKTAVSRCPNNGHAQARHWRCAGGLRASES